MAGYEMNKDELARSLRRIEGQVRGIAQMIDETVTASMSSPRCRR